LEEGAFSVERFRSLLSTKLFGRDCRYEPVVGSTMDVARALIGAGSARHGTLVVADEQRTGKGRFGRRWLTPPGGSLAFSLLIEPELPQLKAMSIMASLAVVEGVRAACGLECQIKWPNDVQARGRKLAGILIDSEIAGKQPSCTIAGVGINVNYDTAAEPEIADIATSVMSETGRRHEREPLLAACINAFERLYATPLVAILGTWRDTLNTLGCRVQVMSSGVARSGQAIDVNEEGSLILRGDDGELLTFPAGEVTLRA